VAKCNLGQVTCRLELIKVILSGVVKQGILIFLEAW